MQKNNAVLKNKKRKRHWDEQRRSQVYSALFLAPSLIGVLLFFVLPFIVVVFYAFVDNPVNKEFVFLDNIIGVLNNQAFRKSAANTVAISAVAVPLAVIISLALAVILEHDIPMKSKFRTFFLSPLMVPIASVVLIWQVIFHHGGVLSSIVTAFGGQEIDWLKSSFSQLVVVLLFLWKNIGYNMVLFMAALANIPKDPLEAASVDGAGPVRQFFVIKMRYLSSTILFVTILSLINSFKVFREIYLLTGNYPYDKIYTLQHYMNNMFRKFDYQKLSAASLIMFVVMVIIVGILFVIDDKFGKDIEQ